MNNQIVLMGPVLQWPTEFGEEPTCGGGCDKGWSCRYESDGMTICGGCKKPSRAYLRECPYCELIWLPTIEDFKQVKNLPNFPRELAHKECIEEYD